MNGTVNIMSSDTKKMLEKILGMTVEQINEMSFDDEKDYVEKKVGKKIIFSKKRDKRMVSRGNPLLVRRRIITMEEIDNKISKR